MRLSASRYPYLEQTIRHNEERERDRQRYREAMEERDRSWKDRMDGALQVQQQSWESRHQMLVTTHETVESNLKQEIDRLRSENYDLRQKSEDKGDIFTQLSILFVHASVHPEH